MPDDSAKRHPDFEIPRSIESVFLKPRRPAYVELLRFIIASHVLMLAHVGVLYLSSEVFNLKGVKIVPLGCMFSSAFLIIKMNQHLESIPSRIAQSLGAIAILPGWLFVIVVEIFYLVEAMGLGTFTSDCSIRGWGCRRTLTSSG